MFFLSINIRSRSERSLKPSPDYSLYQYNVLNKILYFLPHTEWWWRFTSCSIKWTINKCNIFEINVSSPLSTCKIWISIANWTFIGASKLIFICAIPVLDLFTINQLKTHTDTRKFRSDYVDVEGSSRYLGIHL